MNYKFFLLGLLFAALWASASAAAKMALPYVEPLSLFQLRFFLAGVLLISYSLLIKRDRLPRGKEWVQLLLFGALNTTLYLSLFVLSLREISAGIGSLATSTNTLIISALSTVFLGQQLKSKQGFALLLGVAGVGLACYPLWENHQATPRGLFLIFLSMLSYSVGTLYYSRIPWTLSRISINGWQVFFGGLLMLPLTLLFHEPGRNQWTPLVWGSVLWLIFPVSIAAVQLWLYLLKQDTVKASFFLFLCPIFGFIYANLLLQEPLTWFTWAGTAMVLVGLYLGIQKKPR
jgi:probable blue pigment (indigoidine) exporter